MPPPRCRPPWCASSRLRRHLDGVHRALLVAGGTTGAPVVVEAVAVTGSELDHRVLRAGAQTAVALKAVTARQAPAGLECRRLGRQAADDLVESGDALFGRKFGLRPPIRITEVPQVQLVEFGDRVLRR